MSIFEKVKFSTNSANLSTYAKLMTQKSKEETLMCIGFL